jgi:hypothetical protein
VLLGLHVRPVGDHHGAAGGVGAVDRAVLLLETTDPGSIPDVAAWAQSTGNALLTQDKVGPVMRFWIRKS